MIEKYRKAKNTASDRPGQRRQCFGLQLIKLSRQFVGFSRVRVLAAGNRFIHYLLGKDFRLETIVQGKEEETYIQKKKKRERERGFGSDVSFIG